MKVISSIHIDPIGERVTVGCFTPGSGERRDNYETVVFYANEPLDVPPGLPQPRQEQLATNEKTALKALVRRIERSL